MFMQFVYKKWLADVQSGATNLSFEEYYAYCVE